MKVILYASQSGATNETVVRFLADHRVRYEVSSADCRRHRDLPAVEVDGHILVNPNEDALKKYLRVA
jgi:hypothetical protein